MIHPDYQYDPRLVKDLAQLIGDDQYDAVLGTRVRSRREALAGGMPRYKYLANRALSWLENLVSGYQLSEWHTGLRAYKRAVLLAIDWSSNSDDFVFDTQMLFQLVAHGYQLGEVPAPVRYFPAASSINFWRSLRYGLATVGIAVYYWLAPQSFRRAPSLKFYE